MRKLELTRKFKKLAALGHAQATIPLAYRLCQMRLNTNALSVEDFLQRNFEARSSQTRSRTLDLGCGTSLKNPFNADEVFGIDIATSPNRNIIQCDLNISGIPFDEGHFDYVTAFDFIEHVPRVVCADKTRFPFVELMSEVRRVLKVGGLFLSQTPAYPSKEIFQDPTHVNFITEDTFPRYFCDPEPLAETAGYGFVGGFELLAQEWYHSWLITMMQRVER